MKNPGAGVFVRRMFTVVATAVVVTAAGCSEPTNIVPGDSEQALLLDDGAAVRVLLEPGLEQVLTLEPKRLHPGDELSVRSVIRNVSDKVKSAEALVCQLEIRTNMEYQNHEPLILCFAYSASVQLAPNDSMVLSATGIVKDRPGTYSMVVRHVLRPDIRARVRINVYPRPG
jgi:hypothetical protein